jgi:pimeloyl-ACP methyl ester carboxylesterase
MPYVKRDGLQFHYLERGTGVPVIFQHGLGGETAKVFELIELPAGFRLLGLDCRGHGKTRPLGPAEKLSFETFSDDVVALMEGLKLERAVLGGTSMGAAVALSCALRHPNRVRGLVLVRPAWLAGPNPANAKLFGRIAGLLRADGPEEGLRQFVQTEEYAAVLRESPDTAESLRGLFSDPCAVETVARLERIPQDAPCHEPAEWRRLQVPTLVLANRRDPVHPFAYGEVLGSEIPGAKFHEVTAKSVSVERYKTDLRRFLAEFLLSHFPTPASTPKSLC